MAQRMEIAGGQSEQKIAQDPERAPEQILRGRPAWIISDGRAGHLAITLGIAEALGMEAIIVPVEARLPYRLLAPWAPADPGFLDRTLKRPWPAAALGAGRQTVPVLRALTRRSRSAIFTVICQDPKTSLSSADLIWVPQHDALRGANVISTLTPPHRFGAARLAALRRTVPAEIAQLARPRVTLLLGGPGGGYAWPAPEIARFAQAIRAAAAEGASFLITPSRRTPPALLQAIDAATSGSPRWLWQGGGENPYPAFLAHADAFIVTADSVNMVGEASASGRPIHVFHPQGGRPKFRRYHAALEAHGAARPLTGASSIHETWNYQPLDAAQVIAAEIERRWRPLATL
jgi:mitochondrial fission protein ELM1